MNTSMLLNAIGLLVCFVPVCVVGILILGGFIKHRRLLKSVTAAGPELEEIFQLVEAIGTEPSTEFFLAPTGDTLPEKKTLIRLPQLPDFPWGGQCVALHIDHENLPSLHFVESDEERIVVKGKLCRAVSVPRKLGKSGKARSITDFKKIIASSPPLAAKLKSLFGSDVEAALGAIFTSDASIGGKPDWNQEPRYPKCPDCKKNMTLIVEMEEQSALVYLFGCVNHPDRTKTFYQLD